MDVVPELTWRLNTDTGALRLDGRLLGLLGGIERYGSLRDAARKCGVSYRHAWSLMQEGAEIFGQPLAILQRRRGATLSTLGAALLHADREVRRDLSPRLELAAGNVAAALSSELVRPGTPTLHIAASHSVAVLELRRLLTGRGDMSVDLQLSGSLDSLALLDRGAVAVAGFHIPHGEIGAGLKSKFRTYLSGRDFTIVRVAERCQGLMQRADAPQKVRSLTEVAGTGMRFINRQAGSGTRLIVDRMLELEGLTPAAILGYDIEEFTHFAVAALIAGKAADVGIGTAAAAAKFELMFTELVREGYFLALSDEHLPAASRRMIVEVLSSEDFAKRMHEIAGYDVTGAGECMTPEALLSTIGR